MQSRSAQCGLLHFPMWRPYTPSLCIVCTTKKKKTHTARENALVPTRASRTGETVKVVFEVRLYNCMSMLLSIAACTLPLVAFPKLTLLSGEAEGLSRRPVRRVPHWPRATPFTTVLFTLANRRDFLHIICRPVATSHTVKSKAGLGGMCSVAKPQQNFLGFGFISAIPPGSAHQVRSPRSVFCPFFTSRLEDMRI
jgi:hypothetical protein